MNGLLITMEMCWFPIRHTRVATQPNAARSEQGCRPRLPIPHMVEAPALSIKGVCVCVCCLWGGIMVPWCLTGWSPADNQVGPGFPFRRSLCSLPDQQQEVSTSPSTRVCVLCVFPGYFIDVWVIPCVQLCKINSRIKHQMTEIYWAQRDPVFVSFLVV